MPNPSNWQQKKLLYRVLAHKDASAFAELYDQFAPRIYRFVLFKVNKKEEAEDIVSDVFLRTWQYLTKDSVARVKSFSGLVYQIARNAIIDFYRAKATREKSISEIDETGLETLSSDKPNITDLLDQKIASDRLLSHIYKLKQEYQEIILLRFIEELPIADIAVIVKKNSTAVRVTVHRAMKVLKKMVEIK